MAAGDDEKRATIRELKAKFDANNSKLKQLDVQRRKNEVDLRRAAFTAAHLDELPADVVTYRSIGRAYFMEPKPAVMEHLKEVVETADKELKAAAAAREGLVTQTEGLARELNELVGAGR